MRHVDFLSANLPVHGKMKLNLVKTWKTEGKCVLITHKRCTFVRSLFV